MPEPDDEEILRNALAIGDGVLRVNVALDAAAVAGYRAGVPMTLTDGSIASAPPLVVVIFQTSLNHDAPSFSMSPEMARHLASDLLDAADAVEDSPEE